MDQDRTTWSALEYAAALNRAETVADIVELVREVNEKWAAAGEVEDHIHGVDVAAA